MNFGSYHEAIYSLWLFHSKSWISIAESVDLRSFSGNWSAEAPLVVGLLTLNSLKSLVKLPSSTFTRLGIYYQWTRIKNEVSYVYNFFICFYVPQVAQTTWLRRHPAWLFYCVFMKLGGSNFTCDCFTLHYKFWLITRGWGNFQHDCLSCVFMKLSGSNVTCSCFTLHHIFWLIPRGHILLVGASL